MIRAEHTTFSNTTPKTKRILSTGAALIGCLLLSFALLGCQNPANGTTTLVNGPGGWTWTEQGSVGPQIWGAVASSADGTHLVAGSINGTAVSIFTSSDSGVKWTLSGSFTSTCNTSSTLGTVGTGTTAGTLSWAGPGLASSSSGTDLAALLTVSPTNSNPAGVLFTSTDSGTTWSASCVSSAPLSSSDSFSGLAMSANGSELAATIKGGGYVCIYYNTYANWGCTNSGSWDGVAMSSDGTHLAAVFPLGTSSGVWTSSSPFSSWSYHAVAGLWGSSTGIASSSDGVHLAAIDSGGEVWTSSDSGNTWTETGSGAKNWTGIASSSDGTHLAATVYSGYINTSTDSGVTWTQQSVPGSNRWTAIASSSDGTHLVAAVYGGDIWTGVFH